MKSKKSSVWLVIFAMIFLATPGRGGAQTIKITEPDPNLPNQILPQAINDRGDIVGHIGDEHDGTGFLRTRNGQFTEFLFPGQCDPFFGPCTYPQGINNRRQIVGMAFLAGGAQGFLREEDGSVQMLPPSPAGTGSLAQAINDRGDIVGDYLDASFFRHGFLLERGNFTTIDFPGAQQTECRAINDERFVTGIFIEPSGTEQAFLWHRGSFIATWSVANSNSITPLGINRSGDIVGQVVLNNPDGSISFDSFLREPDGTITVTNLDSILQPIGGGSSLNSMTGINDRGDVTGFFVTGGPFQPIFGFLIRHGDRLIEGDPRDRDDRGRDEDRDRD